MTGKSAFCRSCLLELKKHLQSADPEMARKAACGLQFVIDLYTQGHLAFYEDGGSVDRLQDEGFADPFKRTRRWRCLNMAMCWVITNDDGLAWDLLSQRSVKSRYRLHVAAVSSHGWLRKPKAFYELQEYKAWRAERNRRQEAEKNEERRGL